MMVKVTLEYIHREGCHLCDDYLPQFIQFTQQHQINFVQKDVDSNYHLYALYNIEVPAVVLNDKIINQYFFNEQELKTALQIE